MFVTVCMGRRWARLLMAKKYTSLITGAPVRQPFSHESNIYKKQNVYIQHGIVSNISVMLPGIKGLHRV